MLWLQCSGTNALPRSHPFLTHTQTTPQAWRHATRIKSAVVLKKPICVGVHGEIRNVELVARVRGYWAL